MSAVAEVRNATMAHNIPNALLNEYEVFRKPTYRRFVNGGRLFWLNNYPYLDIVLTDHCNAKCRFCIAYLVHEKLQCDPEIYQRKILFAVEQMGVREVLLLGGEPTVSKALLPMVDFLRGLRQLHKICITTNGHRLVRDPRYAEALFASGITHLNLSLMSLDPAVQAWIARREVRVGLPELHELRRKSERYAVRLRINTNVWRGNNDTVDAMAVFYEAVAPYCDSVKFSPLLKTDSFSTVSEVTEFNRKHLLSDAMYDDLWHGLERRFEAAALVRNKETFGFVEYSLIDKTPPIILNYNQHGQLRAKVVNEGKINNLKLLPTGDLSLSWNREEQDFFISVEGGTYEY